MKITIDKFTLEKFEDSTFFDLYRKSTIKKGKNEGQEYIKNIAYGTTFKRCIDIIIEEMVEEGESTVDIIEYLDKYNKIQKEVWEKVEAFENKL